MFENGLAKNKGKREDEGRKGDFGREKGGKT